VPIDEHQAEDAAFAAAGRRLKTAIAVGFVLIWLLVSLYDMVDDPAVALVPGWFSALGAFLLLVFLLGLDPVGLVRRRR
jgi:hypothetical protein